MSPVLREALDQAADLTPDAGLDPYDVWDRARRANRTRALLLVAAVLVVMASGGLVWGFSTGGLSSTPPAGPSTEKIDPALPGTFFAIPERMATTAEAGPLGPLALVGTADHVAASEPLDAVSTRMAYGVSAATGEYRFLSLSGRGGMFAIVQELWLSPDGKFVVYPHYAGDGSRSDADLDRVSDGVAVYNSVTGQSRVVPIASAHGVLVEDAVWSPDGSQVALTTSIAVERGQNAYHYRAANVMILNPSTGQLSEVPDSARLRDAQLTWRPGDEGGLASLTSRAVWVYDPASGDVVAHYRFELPADAADWLPAGQWSPDGERLVAQPVCDRGCDPLSLQLLQLEHGAGDDAFARPTTVVEGDRDLVLAGWADDSHIVFYRHDDNHAAGLYRLSVSSGEESLLAAGPAGTLVAGSLVRTNALATGLFAAPTRPGIEPHGQLRSWGWKPWLAIALVCLIPLGWLAFRTVAAWRRVPGIVGPLSLARYLWARNPEAIGVLVALVVLLAPILASQFLVRQPWDAGPMLAASAAVALGCGRVMTAHPRAPWPWLVLVGGVVGLLGYHLAQGGLSWPQASVPLCYLGALVLLLAAPAVRPSPTREPAAVRA